jgi:hypothetical protein
MQSIGGGRRYQSFKRRRISLLFAIRIGTELWGKISEVYPWATKEQRQKHREIWGEMIENKKRESKRELRNLQSSVNYGDIKASLRCRRDKANRS